jgi:hypothetical protein
LQFGSSIAAPEGTSQTGNLFQSISTLLVSLAIIVALRHVYSDVKERLKVKEAFYGSTYPLVPFVVVVLVLGLQLVPLLLGAMGYGLVLGIGIAVGPIEKAVWALLFFVPAVWSLYMLSGSVFALYVVTLQDTKPLAALRSARQLTKGRRWTILRKLLGLTFVLTLLAAILNIPLIWLAPNVAEFGFFLVSMIMPVLVHAALFKWYRELL